MKLIVILIAGLSLVWTSKSSQEGKVLMDKFQNVYCYTDDGLVKLNDKGEEMYAYSSVSKGEIFHVDVSNPLRISIHFKDNNEVVFLDNTLSLQNDELNLNTLGFYDVSLISNSFQNHLWVYRSAEQKLVRLDQTGNQVAESVMLSTILTTENLDFVSLAETGNYLYLVSASGLIHKFDQYGNYFKDFSLPSTYSKVHFVDENAIYETEDHLILFNTLLQASDTILEKQEIRGVKEILDYSQTGIATRDKNGFISLYSVD